MSAKRILGAALAPCVHVAGLLNFLRLAGECGHETEFLGAAVSVPDLVGAVREYRPDLLAVGYRLTPASVRPILAELRQALIEAGLDGIELVFGGTPPVAAEARASGLFAEVFSGEEDPRAILAYLRGLPRDSSDASHPQTLVERIAANAPYPILRHHFGLPSLEATIRGLAELARAEVLDVLSLGPDQNAQESFFRPAEMDPRQDGAGGVPLRGEGDLTALYEATRRGNHPLLRSTPAPGICSPGPRRPSEPSTTPGPPSPFFGTAAWTADQPAPGRGHRREPAGDPLARGTGHPGRGKRPAPVEPSGRPRHRGRGGCLSRGLQRARALGVRTYVAQFMWNTPPSLSPAMDLAKMLAKLDLLHTLEGPDFRVIRECRAGLASFSPDPAVAKGQLAASTMLSLALRPEILHVVAFCEADHAATPPEIVESCRIVQGVFKNVLFDSPNPTLDPAVRRRRNELVAEAGILLDAIRALRPGASAPLADPAVLAEAVRAGLLDAPHLIGNPEARGGDPDADRRRRLPDGG